MWRAAVILIGLLDPAIALAHTPLPGVGGFYGGLLHPVLVPSHWLTLLGLGLLLGQRGARDRWLIAAFVAGFAVGVGIVAAAYAIEHGDRAVLGTAAVAGIAVAFGRPPPRIAAAVLSAVAALALALDSVPDEISRTATLVAFTGTMVGASLMLTLIARAAASARQTWHRIGIRILGSWTASIALFGLALQLFR